MPARNQLDMQQGWLAACAWLRARGEAIAAYGPGYREEAQELGDLADSMAQSISALPHWLTKLNTP